MIRTSKCQDNFYIVTCADIECAVLASSFEEAANNGLKNILKKKQHPRPLHYFFLKP